MIYEELKMHFTKNKTIWKGYIMYDILWYSRKYKITGTVKISEVYKDSE